MKQILLIFIAIVYSNISFAQFEEEKPKKETAIDWDRVRIGGDFWFSFGDVKQFKCSPKIGYQLTDRFVPGIGINYEYYQEDLKYYDMYTGAVSLYKFKTNIYGASILASYTLVEDLSEIVKLELGSLIAYTEYSFINVDTYNQTPSGYYSSGKQWVDCLWFGGGLNFPLSKRSNVSILVIWDLIQDVRSPYASPSFRFSIGI